jgi:transketolase
VEDDDPQVILIGTGSEVHLAQGAWNVLTERGVRARVVSLPSWELFDAQPERYRSSVLSSWLPKVAVEAAVPLGWERYVGSSGRVVGIAGRFGASAPGQVVAERLGFTAEAVAEAALDLLAGKSMT